MQGRDIHHCLREKLSWQEFQAQPRLIGFYARGGYWVTPMKIFDFKKYDIWEYIKQNTNPPNHHKSQTVLIHPNILWRQFNYVWAYGVCPTLLRSATGRNFLDSNNPHLSRHLTTSISSPSCKSETIALHGRANTAMGSIDLHFWRRWRRYFTQAGWRLFTESTLNNQHDTQSCCVSTWGMLEANVKISKGTWVNIDKTKCLNI